MKSLLCCATMLAGCGFGATLPAGDTPDAAVTESPTADATTQSPITPAPDCGDGAARLCIEFEQGTRDAAGGVVQAANIGSVARGSELAGRLGAASSLRVAERAALDVSPAITLELWARPASLPAAGTSTVLLDNPFQYGLRFEDDGEVQCALAGIALDSTALAAQAWHHVACTYDGAELRIYVDGDVAACRAHQGSVGTAGGAGLTLGARLTYGPAYIEHFLGDLDDVRVFARALVASEICSLAGKAACTVTCPSDEHDD